MRRMRFRFVSVALLTTFAAFAVPFAFAEETKSPVPPGEEITTKAKALSTGAKVLQSQAPLRGFDMHLVGLHPAKEDPSHQMIAYHYCKQVNQDLAQCVLFDGGGADANLIGTEYIVSEKLFATLGDEEQAFWHPHNYEILSGQLVGPGLPQAAEKAALKEKMNSYGKTFHVWHSRPFGTKGDDLPLGEPMLMWSFNADGEAKPGLEEQFQREVGFDLKKKRQARQEFVTLAKPQAGVDALAKAFPSRRGIAGVTDSGGRAVH